MHIAACQNFSPAYRHSTNTATVSSSATEKLTVKQSPPFCCRQCFRGEAGYGLAVLVGPPRLPAGPAGTPSAFQAHTGPIRGECTTRAHWPGMKARQPKSVNPDHLLIRANCPPSRGPYEGTTTAPVPSAPGNPRFPGGPPLNFLPSAGVVRPSCSSAIDHLLPVFGLFLGQRPRD
jgi:hypothetical protein